MEVCRHAAAPTVHPACPLRTKTYDEPDKPPQRQRTKRPGAKKNLIYLVFCARLFNEGA